MKRLYLCTNLIVKLYKYLQIDIFAQEIEVKSFRLKAIIPRKHSTFRGYSYMYYFSAFAFWLATSVKLVLNLLRCLAL